MELLKLRSFIQGSDKKILFCGDDDLHLAAIYLASIIHEEAYDFDYIPSLLCFPQNLKLKKYNLIILSDYPRKQISDEKLTEIVSFIREGGSFLMIGGWESFTGLNIEYKNSPIEDILPVNILEKDDRRNYDQGIIVTANNIVHPMISGLDWEHPAIIGGYNEFIPKDNAQCVLEGQKIQISIEDNRLKTKIDTKKIPLLVYGQEVKGKTAALAFDLAPHWVGGFIDWGKARKHVDFDEGFIEVGDMYYKFVANLLKTML